MDQILPPGNNLIDDELDSKADSSVNSSENFLHNFSDLTHNETKCGNIDEENKLDLKSSEPLLESSDSPHFGDNHVSSTSCAEITPDEDDLSLTEEDTSSCRTVGDSRIGCNSNGISELSTSDAAGNSNKEEDEVESLKELPSSSEHRLSPSLPDSQIITNPNSCTELIDNCNGIRKTENSCSHHNVELNLNPSNEKAVSDHESNFVPTIVEIRGRCTDVTEKPSNRISSSLPPTDANSSTISEVSKLNIVSVLGGYKETNIDDTIPKSNSECNVEEKSNHVIHTISDSEDGGCVKTNDDSDDVFNSEITIKQEPQDSVSDNDCVYMGTEHSDSNFTTEVSVKEEKTSNTEDEDEDVICVETISKTPVPISIKLESNIETESQTSTRTTEKAIVTKRITRSSSSRTEDRVILSSGSDATLDSSDLKKRNRLPTGSAAFSTAGYTCHLCNTVFQEHVLLNDHMILHRNNSLIEGKVQNRPAKAPKMKTYNCDICQKRLSTSQSLQQHVLIHRKEKPFVCPICKKDFRHQSNHKMHLQKHKVDQRRLTRAQLQQSDQERLEKSVVRGVDFGRLVGPLFVKQSLLSGKKRARDTVQASKSSSSSAAVTTTPVASSSAHNKLPTKSSTLATADESPPPPARPRLSFDQPTFKTKENPTTVVSSSASSSAVVIRKRGGNPPPESSSDDECVAVKSFQNIESVVMNANRIIVKLDNMDATVLKRKIQTPDISIEQAIKRCKVMLSPIAEQHNVKLDEIENIPIDDDDDDVQPDKGDMWCAQQPEPMDEERKDDDDETIPNEPVFDTLTDNELLDLLNDDKENCVEDSSKVGACQAAQPAKGDENNRRPSEITQPAKSSADDSVKTSRSPVTKRSNVILMETASRHEIGCCVYGDSTIDDRVIDAFDVAFHRVAVRRLTLLHKKAAENAGQVPSHYLVGPLFWHKALQRAKKRVIESEAAPGAQHNNGGHLRWPSQRRYCSRGKMDDRRTNDPTRLQSRAETKFNCLLDRAKMMNELNAMNLAGPLFWRRTLLLAGIRRGEDLRTFMEGAQLTLDGVEFVNEDGTRCNFGAELTTAEAQPSPAAQSPFAPLPAQRVPGANAVADGSRRHNDEAAPKPAAWPPSPAQGTAKAADSACARRASPTIRAATANSTESTTQTEPPQPLSTVADREAPLNSASSAAISGVRDVVPAVSKCDSILYDSLTRPKQTAPVTPSQLKAGETVDRLPSGVEDTASQFIDSSIETPLNNVRQKSQPADGGQTGGDRLSKHSTEPDAPVAVAEDSVAKLAAAIDPGSIVLNVDAGGALQLIAANGDDGALPEAGHNYVLVADESGAMQYMVNVPSDNFGNFELMANGGAGDQVAYAIQFDGENYTAVQFVPEGVGGGGGGGDAVEPQSDKRLEERKMPTDAKTGAAFLVSNAGTGSSEAVVSDTSHIGKELSDFLHLDYGTALKNGTSDRTAS